MKYKYSLFSVPSLGIHEGTQVHFDHRELSCNSDASHQGVHKRRQPDYQGMLWPDAQLSIVKPARTFVLEKEEGCRRTRPTAFRFQFKLQELEGNQLLRPPYYFQTTVAQAALGQPLSQSTLRTSSSTTTWRWMHQTGRRLVISLQTSSRLAPSGAKTAHLLSEFLLMKL